MDDIMFWNMNALYFEYNINVNCDKYREIDAQHTQPYKSDKLTTVLCFN